MASLDSALLAADEYAARILNDWDITSTVLAGALVLFASYLAFSQSQPDTHPMLLARQAQPSPVRQPGESAIYRSHAAAHGFPLNAGLNVKDAGGNAWSRGRNGDLRDVWRRVISGRIDPQGKLTGEKGRIITVLGSEETIDHDLNQISQQINIIGKLITAQRGSRVAIYLPNSIELLVALFACAFYDLTPILMPYDMPATAVVDMLNKSGADTMVAAVGTLPFDAVTKEYTGLKNLIWVVDPGSKHLDWDEVPSGGAVNVYTWQEEIEQNQQTSSELPESGATQPKNILAFWSCEPDEPGELVEYTHGNIVSAMSAQLVGIPSSQKIGPSDLFLPVDSLTNNYALVLTLSALYYNASVALNSVAGRETDLSGATRGVSPTIIVASPHTLAKVHANAASKLSNAFRNVIHWLQTRTLTQNGILPTATVLTRLNDSLKPSIGAEPGKLRLVFVAEQAGGSAPPLSSMALSDLRIFTGARVIYALTAPKVAGAITQTTFYDYRVDPTTEGQGVYSHFGAPLSSVELFLRDTKHRKVTDEEVAGEICARGPAVVGGETALGVNGKLNDDLTLSYL